MMLTSMMTVMMVMTGYDNDGDSGGEDTRSDEGELEDRVVALAFVGVLVFPWTSLAREEDDFEPRSKWTLMDQRA